MSNSLTESAIKTLAIQLLQAQCYTHLHGPAIAPDSDTPERSRYEDIYLTPRLETALHRAWSVI
jgi:type I restriction enzyme, R subunit